MRGRLERFFVKLFVQEEDLTVHLLVDCSRSMDWGEPNKLRYAVRTAGALGYVALVGLDRVTITGLGRAGLSGDAYLSPRRAATRTSRRDAASGRRWRSLISCRT